MSRSIVLLIAAAVAIPVKSADPPTPTVSLVDQFERRRELRDLRGQVVVMVFGDRAAGDSNRALGEVLHVRYHPAAKGKSGAEAAKAEVIPVSATIVGPDVKVVPVACMGKAPDLVLNFIRREIRKASPDVSVWMDTNEVMKTQFGLRDGEPNIVVIDPVGRLRFRILGTPDAAAMTRLTDTIDTIRRESAGK